MTQTLEERFWSKVDTSGDCWIWTASRDTRGRYGQFMITDDGVHRRHAAHRVAWLLTHGDFPPPGKVVCHRCDNPPCCNPAHLFVGTQADNLRDMWSKGRGHDGSQIARGEARYNAVLTADLVRKIRQERADGSPVKEIAQRYGLDRGHVRGVIRRAIWKHVA